VVSPEIRANTNLRIALRVTDGADSTDVLDAPDAARIPKSVPGRAFARLGHGALVPFQAARIGGRRPGHGTAASAEPFVAPLGWSQLGYPPPERPAAELRPDAGEVTDLSVLVSAVRAAAAAEGVPAQRSPWLDALPSLLPLADLDDVPPGSAVPFGQQDLPARQQRRSATFDPARGHLLVIGAPRSGRSQVLRTVAGAVGARCGTGDVHLYGLDCGNGALLPLQDLPHCGAVVSRSQTERAVRLLDRLARELERRQQVLADGGFADLAEQRASAPPAERLPYLVLLLDRWEGFLPSLGEVDGGRLTDVVLLLLREGASAGISLVVTGDRSLGTSRLASLTDDKLVLRLADRGDYPLMGLPARHVPDVVPPGRGFFVDGAVETQVALLSHDDSGLGQAAALAEIAKIAADRDSLVPGGRRPFRVDVLPTRISFDEAWELLPAEVGASFALVGVGGDDLTAVGPDLAGGAGFVVAGPARSGRSTLLAVMAESLLREGAAIAVAAPKASPLRALAGRPGVLDVVTDAGAPADHWRELLAADPDRPLVVLVDDAEVLRDCPAGEVFRAVLTGAAGPHRTLVLGGHADTICTGLSGWQVEARRSRRGVLLSPQGSADGDLIGVRLPRSAVGGPVQPGRALAHLGAGELLTVAVPGLPC
jgi:DNA segregation ATPase FtsK/SpoIIIE, S-DNA-T family